MAEGVTFPLKIIAYFEGLPGVKRELEKEKKLCDEIHDRFEKLRKKGESSWSTIAVGISAVNNIVGGLNDQIQKVAGSFNSFETSMRAVNTMAGLNEEEFKGMKDSISELGKVIPKTREELADGLYQVISNGVPEDNWLSFLEASAKASVGGIADLGQTVTVTSTIIKNYGLSWEKAADIQDKIQLTAKNGVTSFEQLAAALPRVTGSAATLGVSINELMATFATLTGVSGNTAEVSTQLSAIFTALIKPSSEAAQMAAEMGIQFDAATITAAGGMEQFLTQLKECVQEYSASSGTLETEVYGRLFGSAEAVRALIPLTGELADKFSDNVATMADSEGTIEEAFGQMSATGEANSIMWRNSLAAMTDWIGGVLSSKAPMTDFITSAGQTVMSIGAIASAIKTLMISEQAEMVVKKATILATRAWAAVQAVLNGVLSANPISIIVLAIAALVAGVIAAYQKCDKFREVCDILWAAIKKVAAIVWDSLVKAIHTVVDAIKGAYTWFRNLQQTIHDNVVGAFETVKDAIMGFWNKADGLRSALAKVWEVIKNVTPIGLLIKAFDKVSEAVKKAWNWIKRFVGAGDETESAADALEDEADAADKAADAYSNLADEKAKATGSIRVSGGAKTPAKSNGKPDKAAAPAGSIAAIDAAIQEKQAIYKTAVDAASRAKVKRELDELETQKRIIELQVEANLAGFSSATSYVSSMIDQWLEEDLELEIKLDEEALGKIEDIPETLKTVQKQVRKTGKVAGESFTAIGELGGNLSEVMKAWTGDTENAAAAWLEYGASVAQSMSQVIAAIVAGIAAKDADTQSSNKNTTSKVANAASGFFASFSEIPIVGIILALAAVAGMVATMLSLPKFAAGGLAYGPTMGLFGEYPGAANNPEVVAPLSKLKSLLNTDSESSGRVQFEIKGRKLVGVLAKENNVMARR